MKFLSVLSFILILNSVSCENLSRKKRFLSSLWPSSSSQPASINNKENEVVYVHIPPEYVEMMHHELLSRADNPSHSPKYVQPTKMSVINKQPANSVPIMPSQTPKIIMRPILKQEQSPSVKVTQEQVLPEIHKTHRFVMPTPFPKTITEKPIYNTQQALPIKRVATPLKPSIKTADISEFYHTKEFSDLLDEFKLKVDLNKLPDIKDVMIILNTDDAEETLQAMREVAGSSEGMELIKTYLEGSDRVEDDEFYNYHEDVGLGEIRVGGNDYHHNYIQSDDASQYNFSPVENPVTTTPPSWWQRPLNWLGFGNNPQADVTNDAIEKNSDILTNVIRQPDSIGSGLSYVGNFFSSTANRDKKPINPPFEVKEKERFLPSEGTETVTLPTVRMSEEEFNKMAQDLHLVPLYTTTTTTTSTLPPPQLTTLNDQLSIPHNEELPSFKTPINVVDELVADETQVIDIPDPQIPQKVERPVIPPQLSEYENRRNFLKNSEPIRHSSIESRTGKVYQADPVIVEKETHLLSNGHDEGKFCYNFALNTLILINF